MRNDTQAWLEHAYVWTSCLLIVHQVDSAYWQEWRMFGLSGDIQGFVLGNVANLLANADSQRTQHLARVERATLFLRGRGVPRELRERVHDYYDYLWESRMDADDQVLDDLPPPLRTEIAMVLARPILDRVPFLRGASEAFLRAVVRHLKPSVFTPGEIVLRRGDVGHRMYFIRRGEVEVLAADGVTRVATLGDGDYFGEMALLTREPRSASIRALDYCDFYTLDREHFADVLATFPEFAEEVRRTAAARAAGANAPAPQAPAESTRPVEV